MSLVINLNSPVDLQAPNSLSDSEIDRLIADVLKADRYPIEETEIRNCLIVGRSRTGKSTACGVLKNPVYEPAGMSIFSDTREPKFQSFVLQDKARSKKYTLNIIDSPGVDEVKAMGTEARPDKAILDTIKYCVRNEVTKLHCLFLFVSFATGINRADINAFKLFFDNFYHANLKVAIVITRSESSDQTAKEHLVNELKQQEFFSRILAMSNVTVLFMGCVDQDTASKPYIDLIKNLYIHVYQMRKQMLEFIFSAEQPVMMNQLPLNRIEIEACRTLIEDVRGTLRKFQECRDIEMPWVVIDLARFEEKMKQFDDFAHFEYDAALRDYFSALRADAIAVRDSPVFGKKKPLVDRVLKFFLV